MWSTVILSTGLVLLIGCGVAGALLVRKQIRHGITGFGVLATSDSILSVFIGVLLVGLGLLRDDVTDKISCSKTMMFVSSSTFLLPFVNSFISMLLMSLECWANAKIRTANGERRSGLLNSRRRRLSFETTAQWFLPVLSVFILYQLTPDKVLISTNKLGNSNDTCPLTDLLSTHMISGCKNETSVEMENPVINNLTYSVVQRIYDLLNETVPDEQETSKFYLTTQPQTKEEWKNIFTNFQLRDGNKGNDKNGRVTDHLPSGVSTLCNVNCISSFRTVQAYVTGLLMLIYAIPMLGTLLLHRSTKNANRHGKTRSMKESQDITAGHKDHDKVCHLKEIKMIALSNFVMWTPALVEKFIQKWLCNSAPKWLVAILYIIGQMNTIIRGVISANTASAGIPPSKNIIIPLQMELEPGNQAQSERGNKMEILFHKREN